MIIQLNEVTKIIGGELLFEKLNLSIKTGEKIGIIGRNGSGKSTLLKLIMGIEGIDEGAVSLRNGLRLAYLRQERVVDPNLTARDFLLNARPELLTLAQELSQLEEQLALVSEEQLVSVMTRYGKKQELFQDSGGYELEDVIQSTTQGLGINSLLAQKMMMLSGGQQTLMALAHVLISEADVLILDEPTNHLDVKGLNWLENYLQKAKKTVIVVSHDRYFLNQVVNRVVEIDNELHSYPGNYDAYEKSKKARLEVLAKDYQEQQKEIKKIKDAIRRYRQWGNESDNAKFFKRAKHLEKRLAQMDEISRPAKEQVALMKAFKFSQRSGKEVLQLKNLYKSYDSRELLVGAELNVSWQDKVAIQGSNGCGKSTLLKIILGQVPVDQGEVDLGSQVEIGYLSQNIHYEEPRQTVLENFKRSNDLYEEDCRRILAKYLFFKEDVFRQVGKLSGGEQVRLELAKLMQQGNNLLILDEPTNHLDIETRELLEKVLQDYQGTVIVVSHDRYFLKKTIQRFVVIEEGKIQEPG